MSYLREALSKCVNLKILKIEFNGYSIADQSLQKIIKEVEEVISNQNR